MHKVYLFDCGNVLVQFSREHHLDVFVGPCKEDQELVFDAVFKDWFRQDAGLPSLEFCEIVKQRLPERLHKGACDIILHWPDSIWPMPGMEGLVKELKEAGVKLILVSNMPDVYPQLIERVSALQYFDDLIYSFPLRLVKPDAAFFQYVLKKHQLNPEDCLFIDDTLVNVEAARNLGIDSYHFDKNHPEEFIRYVHEKEMDA